MAFLYSFLMNWRKRSATLYQTSSQISLDSGRLPKDSLRIANLQRGPACKSEKLLTGESHQHVLESKGDSYPVCRHKTNYEHETTSLQARQITPKNLLNSHEQWTQALDRKSGVDVIYFYFKKAFDCVPHLWLPQKLDQLGIACRLHSWIQTFLTKRTL